MKKIIFTLFAIGIVSLTTHANNVLLYNLSTNYNSTTGVCVATFNLSWENSWRSNALSNWDAAWIFFKFKDGNSWRHLDLTGNNVTLPSGFTSTVPSDKKGIFIYRSSAGSGNNTLTGCEVGISPQMGTFDLKAFAIEMVYIPTAYFYLGDGSSFGTYRRGDANVPFQVTTGNASSLYIGNNYYYELNDSGRQGTSNFADGWPTGVDAFYCMKYEATRGQFRDFLNCLTYDQQITNFGGTAPNASAGSIIGSYWTEPFSVVRIMTPGNATTKVPAVVACNRDTVSGYDGGDDGENLTIDVTHSQFMAYLDWAALRIMTEMEYEKICRGPNTPIAGEYAYGSNTYDTTGLVFTHFGTDSQSFSNSIIGGRLNISNNNKNHSTQLYQGPIRSGSFATGATSRLTSGGSYYGVMEMSGNQWEKVVTSYNTAGRSYTAKHGDGTLTATGYANVDYWPGQNGATNSYSALQAYNGGDGASGAAGIAKRGGGFWDVWKDARVSDRFIVYSPYLNYQDGIRGVRTE